MKLELRVRHLRLDPAMRDTCDRHLLHSLGRLEEQIRRVQLWIEDLNGPRGGRDIRCCLRICLRRGGALTVEAVDAVPQVAVGEVFDRPPPRRAAPALGADAAQPPARFELSGAARAR